MKFAALAFVFALSALSVAQIPNTLIKLDARIVYRTGKDEGRDVRAYDLLGNHSVVTLEIGIEPGFDVVLSERFQRIKNDPDKSQVDEFYIEDRGYWRAGKQYVGLGSGAVLRESLTAAQFELRAGQADLPLKLSLVSGDSGHQEGVVARIGDTIGFSALVGRNFGINATALTVIRKPEETPGVGRGYKLGFGVDGKFQIGPATLVLDHVSLSQGETALDLPLEISNADFTWRSPKASVTLGATKEWKSGGFFPRVSGETELRPGFHLIGMVRFKDESFWDLAIGVRIKP